MWKGYRSICLIALVAGGVAIADAAARGAAAQNCSVVRKINIGVSVAPPNVVHTSPQVAKELGFFAKRCIEPISSSSKAAPRRPRARRRRRARRS